MGEVAFNLILAPLILFFGQTYIFFSRGTGLYGFGLILLSLLTYISFLPLRNLISRWSAQDRFVGAIVKGKIQAIPKTLNGREKHRLIAEIHERYTYGLLNSLRASMGMLTQIPLFVVGYLTITNLPEINGRPFGLISDLGKPDQLLGAVNLLPLIMTALNIVTTFIEGTIDKKEKITAIAISFLFLFILYNEPSALLVYWTFNNLIYLFTSLVHKYWQRKPLTVSAIAVMGNHSGLLNPFLSSVLLNAALLGGASITVLLMSDESFYREDLVSAIGKTSILTGLVIYVGYYAWKLCPGRFRFFALYLAIFSSLLLTIYIYFYSRDFGEINGGALTNESIFTTRLLLIDDLIIASVVAVVSFILLRKFFRIIVYFNFASLLLVASILLFAFINKDSSPSMARERLSHQARVPAHNPDHKLKAAHSLSPTGMNTVVFLLDMFEGGHVDTLLQQYPNVFAEYTGFVWYSNTLSVSKTTRWSLPAIYGGWEFSLANMNSRGSVNLEEESCSAYAKLATKFSNENWRVNLVNPILCLSEEKILRNVPKNINVAITYDAGKEHLDTMIADEGMVVPTIANNNAKFRNFYVSLGLFKAMPNFIKEAVYDSGRWHDTNLVGNIVHKLEGLSLLHFLSKYTPQLGPQNTLTFFYTDLTHTPWFLGEHKLDVMADPYPATIGQLKVVNGVIPEQIFTEKHAISLIGSYLKNLKSMGLYDNTRVILVSDHGFGNSAQLNAALGAQEHGVTGNWLANNRYPGYPHALLMIKEPKAAGALRQNRDSFMSNADVFDIICADLEDGCTSRGPGHYGEAKRVLPYYDRHLEDDGVADGKLDYRTFFVTDSIFSLSNWSRDDGERLANGKIR
jgi:hypothetical protein